MISSSSFSKRIYSFIFSNNFENCSQTTTEKNVDCDMKFLYFWVYYGPIIQSWTLPMIKNVKELSILFFNVWYISRVLLSKYTFVFYIRHVPNSWNLRFLQLHLPYYIRKGTRSTKSNLMMHVAEIVILELRAEIVTDGWNISIDEQNKIREIIFELTSIIDECRWWTVFKYVRKITHLKSKCLQWNWR